ncbi:MAG TPA: ATP-binding protein [Bryobacteraceae bacterium]|nr:ATP-binding protein [Bryobacteraceae bacterium]
MAKKKAGFRFSPRILDHLGISAYNSVQKCLSELGANAYDADADKLTVTLPDALDDSSLIEIEDTGVGMSYQDITEKFLFVGLNRRADGQRTAKGRLVIGSKGIGKLAGFGIASTVEITSWKDGTQCTFKIERESLEDIKALSEHELTIITSQTERSNGTRVRLMKLAPELNLPSPEVIRRHLYRTLPTVAGFKIIVNGVECTPEDVPGERHEFSENLEGIGPISGFYIIANARQHTPGLAVRVRKRIVKEPSLFGVDTRSHGFFTAEKIIGEVHAEFLDSEDAAQTRRDLISTTRDGFLEDSPIVRMFDEWAKDFLEKVIRGVDELEGKKRADSLLDRPAVKERLERMPPHVRGTASKVVRGILAKLRNVEEEEAAELIEWVLRYYESNILRELMRAIVSADVQDAEKLAALVEDWGLKQVNSVVEIIKDQIGIIGKLEEVVASDAAKEMDLHKLIEGNLWLIREGLELWSSDKPLKKVLDLQIDKIYRDREDIRPDLICRSRDNGNEAAIMEFKRPKETIVMEHVSQALEYEALLKKHRPNIVFTTYVVGRQYHPSVLATREKLEGASLHLWSMDEILQKARMRFEKILEILGR